MNALIHAVKKENGILIDWCEFTILHCQHPSDIIDYLGLSSLDWEEGISRYGYHNCLSSHHISILYGGRDDMGIHVIMSGQGCRAFETYSSEHSFDSLLKSLSGQSDAHFTRLDVAYDDFNGLIDLESIESDIRSGLCVSRFRQGNIIASFDICHSDIRNTTINFGKQGSNTWITMYNKLSEQHSKDIIPDVDYWVRCEIKMRHVNADRFVELFSEGKPLSELYFLVLNNYLRFVVPSDSDTNKWRWALAPHWEKFCNSVVNDSISLFVAASDDYNTAKLTKYVTGQAAAACYTYIQRFGISDFMLKIGKKRFQLNQKYEELLDSGDLLDVDTIDLGVGFDVTF